MFKQIILILLLTMTIISCQGNADSDNVVPAKERQKPGLQKPVVQKTTVNTDEIDFRRQLALLKTIVQKKDLTGARAFMNFPFFTSKAAEGNEIATDPISAAEYQTYKYDIFNVDILRLLPKYTEEQLSEIDSKTQDRYYISLKKITDPGSKLYELYFQYAESGTHAESYFGFVFGKIKTKYKVIAMYSKWPIK